MVKEFIKSLSTDNTIVQIGQANKIECINVDEVEDYLKNNENKDIFFLAGLNPELGYKRACEEDITHKSYVYFDFDIRKENEGITDAEIIEKAVEAMEKLKTSKFALWSHVVFTGNGIHIYYSGDTTEVKKTPYSIGYELLSIEISKIIGINADSSCKNLSRIARLPGSYNNKGEKKFVEVIASQDVKSSMVKKCMEFGQRKQKMNELTAEVEKEVKREIQIQSGDKIYEEINKISIIDELLDFFPSWKLEPNGKNFLTPTGNLSAAYVSSDYENTIICDASREFANLKKKSVSTFTLVKHLYNLDDKGTFEYFKNKYPAINNLSEKQKDEWKKKNQKESKINPVDILNESEEKIDFDEMFNFSLDETPFTWFTHKCNTLFPPIDKHHLIFFAGAPSSGKTTLSIDMAIKNAKIGKKVLYIGLEMSKANMIKNLGKKRAGITIEQWRDKKLITDAQRDIAIKTCNEIQNMENLKIIGFGGKDATSQNIQDVIMAADCDIIMIDNFNLVLGEKGESDNQTDARVSKDFMNLTNKIHKPIIFLHHVSKQKDGERVSLNSMRGSGKIADNADTVIVVERNYSKDSVDEFEEQDESEKCKTKLFCRKDRDFGTGAPAEIYFKKGIFVDEYYQSAPNEKFTKKKLDNIFYN